MKSFTKKGFLIHFSSLFARAGEPEPLDKKRGAGALREDKKHKEIVL